MIIGFILAAGLVLYMSGLFLISLIIRNNGVADIGYGIGVGLLAAGALYLTNQGDPYVLALAVLLFVWAARLAVRIFFKNVGKPEDFRYKAWRRAWGIWFIPRSFLQIYMLQGTVIFIVALPVILAAVFPASAMHLPLFFAGVAVWLVGFVFESLADLQLDVFMRNPHNRGHIMTRGLWHYSRHPNYFGESLIWWGIALAAAGLSGWPLLGFISPILITFLLRFVSGVPLLEKRWQGNPEWEAYKKKTNAFVPFLPKKS